MTEQKSNILSIDGKEYPTDNLKDEQKVLIDQITICQNEIKELSKLIRKLDIFEIAKKDYIQRLSTSLQNDETIKTMDNSKAG
mgnify:CR=1 FL=1|tara:strand:+ start:66 stop:314 length:249 start_codon:yes stop_codon:yes gene_type:complete